MNKANEELKNKSAEITAQNEELKASQQNLDRTNSILNQQRRELIDIKGSLEDTVRERTNDLLSLNKRLLFQNQQLEQYAYITSPNLRAPIAQIKGLVHLLPHDNEFDGKTKETLTRLAKSTTGMEKVFADLSMILNVKNSLQNPWKDVDIIHEISEVVQALNSSIIEKNIQIDVPSYQSFIIKAQRPYVYSIFHNLVENAIKYADGKKTKAFIKIVLSETEKYVKISISDNGIGIDMEAASGKVFQMYQRFNNTHPGQGFGLFLVKSQMEAMRGKVELESILGQGSTFNLYFSKN